MSNAYINAAKKLRVGKRGAKQPIAKAILLFLADAANDDGFCYPSISYIADVLELGESTVRKHLTILADKKNPFIEKKKIKKNNGYQMKFAPQKPKTPLRDSGENGEYRYVRESSPLRGVTATTERINITLKGTETSLETFLDLNTQCVSVEDFYKKAGKQICAAMKVFNLPNEDRWKKQMKWAFDSKFSPEEFSDCYKLLLNRTGRRYPVTPEQIADNLPFLTELRLQTRKSTPIVQNSSQDECEDCDDESREIILKNFTEGLNTGVMTEQYIIGQLIFFSDNDRAWFTQKLSLEDAA